MCDRYLPAALRATLDAMLGVASSVKCAMKSNGKNGSLCLELGMSCFKCQASNAKLQMPRPRLGSTPVPPSADSVRHM